MKQKYNEEPGDSIYWSSSAIDMLGCFESNNDAVKEYYCTRTSKRKLALIMDIYQCHKEEGWPSATDLNRGRISQPASGKEKGSTHQSTKNGSITNSKQANNSSTKTTKNSNKKLKQTPDAQHCITRDTTSNEIGDFLVNKCNFPVNVQWIGPPFCMDNGGCMSGVPANGKSAVTKIAPNSQYSWVACPYPAIARAADGVTRWNNDNQFVCID